MMYEKFFFDAMRLTHRHRMRCIAYERVYI